MAQAPERVGSDGDIRIVVELVNAGADDVLAGLLAAATAAEAASNRRGSTRFESSTSRVRLPSSANSKTGLGFG